MNVRDSTVADDAALVAMGRKFYASLPYGDVSYCGESARRWFALMRASGVLIVAEHDGAIVGMAGGLFAPFIFNDAHLVGSELMWWVEPEYRSNGIGRLMLAALERGAAEAGCVRWSMVATQESPAIEHACARAGYELSELTFTKVPKWP